MEKALGEELRAQGEEESGIKSEGGVIQVKSSMRSQPGVFEGWGGASLGRKDRGQCGWTEGSRQQGLLHEEGLKIWLRTGAFPQRAAERFPVC